LEKQERSTEQDETDKEEIKGIKGRENDDRGLRFVPIVNKRKTTNEKNDTQFA
jgi:hypothetical protein